MSKYEYEVDKKNMFRYELASIADLFSLLEKHPRIADDYDLDEWLGVLDEIFDSIQDYGK